MHCCGLGMMKVVRKGDGVGKFEEKDVMACVLDLMERKEAWEVKDGNLEKEKQIGK